MDELPSQIPEIDRLRRGICVALHEVPTHTVHLLFEDLEDARALKESFGAQAVVRLSTAHMRPYYQISFPADNVECQAAYTRFSRANEISTAECDLETEVGDWSGVLPYVHVAVESIKARYARVSGAKGLS